MAYQVPKNWKDLVEFCKHPTTSRREFVVGGLLTLFLPELLLRSANAADLACPPTMDLPGSIVQILAEGGPTMGARFFSDQQASIIGNAGVGSAIANNYGITGLATNIVKIGPNLNVDQTSPFGATLLKGPPGYTAAQWASVLRRLSGAGHLGPFNQDDGAGLNLGLLGAVTPHKASRMQKDVKIIPVRLNEPTAAKWAVGTPNFLVRSPIQQRSVAYVPSAQMPALTSTAFTSALTLDPPAAGLITGPAFAAASNASVQLRNALAPVLGLEGRKGAGELLNRMGCAFDQNRSATDPTAFASLFTLENVPALQAKFGATTTLSVSERALLATYFQSARGVVGGVIQEYNGRDYHNTSVANILQKDVEEARNIVMWLAACDLANAGGGAPARSALIYLSNGQAIASGVTMNQSLTLDGTAMNVNVPIAQGDAGGAYNAGLVIFYQPTGAPVVGNFTGTLSEDGRARPSAKVTTPAEAVAGLYASALAFVSGGAIPTSFSDAVKNADITTPLSDLMVI